jgi:hypothetical protein
LVWSSRLGRLFGFVVPQPAVCPIPAGLPRRDLGRNVAGGVDRVRFRCIIAPLCRWFPGPGASCLFFNNWQPIGVGAAMLGRGGGWCVVPCSVVRAGWCVLGPAAEESKT